MKNVLILESHTATADEVEGIFNDIDKNIIVYKSGTLSEAYQISIEHQISLFVVDIIIDHSVRSDVSGLNFVEKIRTIERYAFVPVIFLSSLDDPQLFAYRILHCYGYLEKPLLVSEARELFVQALKFEYPEKQDGTIFFRKDGVIYGVNKKDIIYIRSRAGVITIKTVKEEFTVYYRNCENMMKQLDSERFINCNRGLIINRDYIESFDIANRVITFINGYDELRMSKRMKKEFLDQMSGGTDSERG